MSEEFKQTTAEDVPPPISHTRILWIMAIVLIIATIVSLIFATWHVTAVVCLNSSLIAKQAFYKVGAKNSKREW